MTLFIKAKNILRYQKLRSDPIDLLGAGAEALQKGLITGGQPARKLKEQPEIIKGLHEYNQSVQQIPRLNIRIRTITSGLSEPAKPFEYRTG